jgi:hypothetical protein
VAPVAVAAVCVLAAVVVAGMGRVEGVGAAAGLASRLAVATWGAEAASGPAAAVILAPLVLHPIPRIFIEVEVYTAIVHLSVRLLDCSSTVL